jgi:hypothetical protein
MASRDAYCPDRRASHAGALRFESDVMSWGPSAGNPSSYRPLRHAVRRSRVAANLSALCAAPPSSSFAVWKPLRREIVLTIVGFFGLPVTPNTIAESRSFAFRDLMSEIKFPGSRRNGRKGGFRVWRLQRPNHSKSVDESCRVPYVRRVTKREAAARTRLALCKLDVNRPNSSKSRVVVSR